MDLGGGQQSSGEEKQYTLDLMDGKPGIEVKSPITDGLCELKWVKFPYSVCVYAWAKHTAHSRTFPQGARGWRNPIPTIFEAGVASFSSHLPDGTFCMCVALQWRIGT